MIRYIYISFDPKSYMSVIWINFRKSLGLSLGFAMTLVMDTMVLRLILGFSHGCGPGLRSLDLMVLLGCDLFHVYLKYILSCYVFGNLPYSLSIFMTRGLKLVWRKRRSGQLSCFNFSTKRTRSASFCVFSVLAERGQKQFWQFCRFGLLTSFCRIFWLVYLFSVIPIAMFSSLSLLPQ